MAAGAASDLLQPPHSAIQYPRPRKDKNKRRRLPEHAPRARAQPCQRPVKRLQPMQSTPAPFSDSVICWGKMQQCPSMRLRNSYRVLI